HRLEVVAGLHGRAEAAVRFLLLVLELDLAVIEADLVARHYAVTAASGLERGDQQVGQSDLEVLLLVLAGLPAGQDRLLEVDPGGASDHEFGRTLVALHDEVEVLHADLAGAAAAAARVRAGLALAPGPRLQVDLTLVLGVLGLALDAVDL